MPTPTRCSPVRRVRLLDRPADRRDDGPRCSASSSASGARLRGDYLAIRPRLRRDHPHPAAQHTEITGGPNGIGSIPKPTPVPA
ncbi:hypothetical protein ACPA9J_12380 [Pseudomonas aeruginosa]